MQTEERLVQDRILVYELDQMRGIALRPRERKNKNNDAAMKTLVLHFDHNANMNDEQFLNHLRAIQYRLTDNGFNNWDD